MTRSRDGFSLIEVLVALSLLGIALVPIMGSLGQSMRLAQSSKMKTYAALLAREHMARLELEGFPEVGETEGGFELEDDEDDTGTFESFWWSQVVGPPPRGPRRADRPRGAAHHPLDRG